MPKPTPRRVVLYERLGCHLCEDAAVLLDRFIGADAYERIEIEPDDDLLLRYGHRIPVITLDGVERLELLIDAEQVRALAAELHNTPPA
jgi:hypothetical protein